MATSSSTLILLLAVSFAAGASTTSFSITNQSPREKQGLL
jgi:hypothetical protein